MERRTANFGTLFTVAGDVIRDALENAYKMGEAKDRRFRRINEVTCLLQDLDRAGFEIVPKAKAGRPHIEERTTIAGVTTTRTVELVPGGQETETEKAAREASMLIAQILDDCGQRQSEVGVAVAATEALARLKRDRGRMAFEDIDRSPPYNPSLASELLSTWVRNLGDTAEACQGRLSLRKLSITAELRREITRDQHDDLNRRLDLIRSSKGVVGADPISYAYGKGGLTLSVEVRFNHYITLVGVDYAPLDLPIRKAA